ncbi:MAG: right-handed parallel beta-helix repeat-containing protein, partial [Candidatus Eisenbacteria bacterium]
AVTCVSEYRITFRLGSGPGDTLQIPYDRNHALGESHPGFTRAVVMVHGTNRTACSYYDALELTASNAGHAEAYTLLLAPQFLIQEDLDSCDAIAGQEDLLFWKNGWSVYTENDSCWKFGGLSRSTTNHPRPHAISSFAVMDSILYRLGYWNADLDTIIVAGHSAGGMFVHRYAASNRMEQTLAALWGITVKYVVANPSAFLYLTNERRIPGTVDEFQIPASTADDPDYVSWYNDYPYGLSGLTRDAYLNAVGATQIVAQYPSRRITYLSGELDVLQEATLDKSAQAKMQGLHRRERGRVFYNYMIHLGWNDFDDRRQAFIPGAHHDKDEMFDSACGMYALFDYGSCQFNPLKVQPGQTTYTIQDALDDAVQGMTVLLEDGTFQGHRESSPVYGKALTIRSRSGDPSQCIIDCQSAGRGFEFHYDETYSTVLKGVTILNGYTDNSGGGILCMGASPSIRDCILRDCDTGGVGGGGGLACMYAASPTIVRTTFDNNYAWRGGGIYCQEYSQPTIDRSIITGSRFGSAVYSDATSTPAAITCTDIHGNTGGDWTSNISAFQATGGNLSASPLYCAAPADLHLCQDSPCLAAAGDCAPHMGAQGQGCDSCGTYVCCKDGVCSLFTDRASCAALGGVWHPEWQSCEANPCPAAEGACCLAGTVCDVRSEAACIAGGGSYQGNHTSCGPNPCPGVCCLDGVCDITTASECATASGDWHPEWSNCLDSPCVLAPCCEDTTCSITIEQDCADAGGTWRPEKSSCSPNPCVPPDSAVCCLGQACFYFSHPECDAIGGTWFAGLESCDGSPCWQAVCCVDGACSITWEMSCTGVWVADSIFCTNDPCEEGVCCSDAGCAITIRHDCVAAGGVWHPEWDSCDPDPCRLRACCNGGACAITLESDCAYLWMDGEESCSPNPCLAGCCTLGDCTLMTEDACASIVGVWHPDFVTCGPPDPCPAVCCYGTGSCALVPEGTCASMAGTWHPEGLSCDPNPCFHIVYPDTTGGRPTLQAAIESIPLPGTNEAIGLKNGVFDVAIHQGAETGGIDYKGRRITVLSLSDRPDQCVIDAASAVRGFYFHSGEGASSKLQGVTISGGDASQGGGIFCSGASPTFANCVFRDNQATNDGGGLCLLGPSSPALYDCDLLDNAVTGSGGGIFGGAGSSVWMQGCLFAGNSAGGSGGGLCGAAGSLGAEALGCTFYGNAAASGGGLYFGSAGSRLDRALISGNTGGGIACTPATVPFLWCCDIHGNDGGDWSGLIHPQYGSNANTWQSPLLCDPPADLTLAFNSPCAQMFSPCGQVIGARGVGCGAGFDAASDLSGGVLLVHHPPGLQYTADTPSGGWGRYYRDHHAIDDCTDQNARIDDTGTTELVWYVLGAWAETKTCCGVEFGFGNYPAGLFEFVACGSGFPEVLTETPTAGWPGPGEGVTVMAGELAPLRGNYVPLYWFAGYNDDAQTGVIPLAPHPTTMRAGTFGCDPGRSFHAAVSLGGMGLRTDGITCCPPVLPGQGACCRAGECTITLESECDGLGGVWYATEYSCLPNPCPAACCTGEACDFVTQAACAGLGGTWYEDEGTCAPNPCLQPDDWATHDIGSIRVTMTDRGVLGFLDETQAEGEGIVYPLEGTNCLWIGSLWVSGGTGYVANLDYAADPAREWTVALDPPGYVEIDESGTSHQDILASYVDSAAASPRGWRVEQESWAYAVNTNADDLVILRYRIKNEGTNQEPSLYAGLFLDLDITNPYLNTGGVDASRDLVYMADSSDVHLGARLLQDVGDPGLSNLTLIKNSEYVWPNSYILDADKYAFLSAADPAHVMTASPFAYDYGVLVAAGPFALLPGQEELVCFAIVGGEDLRLLQAHADAAQLIYVEGFADVDGDAQRPVCLTALRAAEPNPFRSHTAIRFELPRTEAISLGLYDVGGRCLRTLVEGPCAAGRYTIVWDGRDEQQRAIPGGIYFIKLQAGEIRESRRVVYLR